MSAVFKTVLLTVLAAGALAASGCLLFDQQVVSGFLQTGTDAAERTSGGKSLLPPISAPKEAVQVEFVIVERPADDPLLGGDLWREVGQVGALTPELRAALEQNGFRIGHVGSTPPPALETMLGITSQFDENANNDEGVRGRRHPFLPGGDTEVQTSNLAPEMSLLIHSRSGESWRDFEQARCLFRVKAERKEDGWAAIELTPEIHYGQNRLRPVAGLNKWDLKTTQDVHPFYNQRFTVLLNVGEMAVVTCDGEQPESVGGRFFLAGTEAVPVQRLLIVRLADAGASK